MATFDKDTLVQVLIRRTTDHGVFSDAFYLSKDEFDALSDEDVEALKITRVNKWIADVEASSKLVTPEPTKEELEAVKADLTAQVAELEAKIASK